MTDAPSPPVQRRPADSLRELQAAREIAHAFLTADGPLEVYRLALERVARLVGATFGCVFLQEGSSELLRVVAAYNWPRAFAEYLSEMRVRIGNGPTGQAVAEGRMIEVFDIFADPQAVDWRDAAREIGFASSISVPLQTDDSPVGAITFYFREPEELQEIDRSLLRLVADQLAATVEKAHLIDDLQKANDRLREQNVELEARYREAEEARRLKNEFLANISHELRTPLTAILGYAYLLREGLSGELGGDAVAAVQKIEASGTALMGLINDLLDHIHLKLGRTTLEAEACDAAALGQAALSTVPPAPQGVQVAAELPGSLLTVYTDPGSVVRILRNLLSNAAKFTAQGRITLRVRAAPGPAVEWEVEDTGIGIAPDDLVPIFEEFRQVDGSPTRRYGGTGIGLALSRALARRLGGDIGVRSVPGQGSVFTLRLPVQRPDA